MLVNELMRELFQFQEEVIGKTFEEALAVMAPEVRAASNHQFDEDRLSFDNPEVELTFANPHRTFIRRVTPVTAGDDTLAFVVVYQDVTKERAALRAKDQLLSIAAHELRTPLTAMLGFTELVKGQLQHETVDREAVNRRIATIHRETRRLAKLVEQLLGLAQLESGSAPLEISAVNVSDLVARVIERFSVIPKQAGRLQLVEEITGIVGQWDENRVEQILTNIIDNALKYSPGNAPIEIRVSLPETGQVQFLVRDQGPGLTTDELGHLFRPFSRLGSGSAGGGLGLGLYVSRTLAERHGGKLWLESPHSGGVSAWLHLPLDPSG
jgi:signal transduction histidine kinase